MAYFEISITDIDERKKNRKFGLVVDNQKNAVCSDAI